INWPNLLTSFSLLLTAYTIHEDSKAHKVENIFTVAHHHAELSKQALEKPELNRVLRKDVDLDKQPISDAEALHVKLRILHLDSVHRASNMGMFVRVQGLQRDIKDFFSAPIPRAVWEKLKPFQDDDFVVFVENAMD